MIVNRHSPGTALRRALITALAAGCLAAAVGRLADPWTPPGLPAAADPETERGRRLDEQILIVRRRSLEQLRLARDVAAGRLGLVEAAAGYRDLTADDPTFNREVFRRVYTAGSDEERYCRQVIVFVRVTLHEQPGPDPAVVGRLEAELQDRLEQGELRLSAPVDGSPGTRPDDAPALVGGRRLDFLSTGPVRLPGP
jgi:hypothetical protein